LEKLEAGRFQTLLDVVVNTFGAKCILFGYVWPVCLVAASYEKILGIVEDYFSAFSKEEQEQFFGLNATRFYNL
jgi:L-fuconolactonase